MNCLYCGVTDSPPSDEHVLSDKLGCNTTIPSVCEKCNNGILSYLDTAILDHSPLALINTYRDIDAEPAFLWGTSEALPNQLLEGKFDPKTSIFSLYPQLLLLDNGNLEIHGDASEMENYGHAKLKKLLTERAIASLENKPGIRFNNQEVDLKPFDPSWTYPPRAFGRSIAALERNEQMTLRYTEIDPESFIAAIRSGSTKSFANLEVRKASTKASFCLVYSTKILQRALIKFALNSIAYACLDTEVNNQNFNSTAKIVLDIRADDRLVRKHSAQFVPPSTLQSFHPSDAIHAIRLAYSYRHWQCSISFFNGAAAALVTLPGICDENWRSCDIYFPHIKSRATIETYSGSTIATGRASWELADLLPTISIENFKTVNLGDKKWKGLKI